MKRICSLIVISLFSWSCYAPPPQRLEEICHPSDPRCADQDFDGDGVVNGIDHFPLDPQCATEDQNNCGACGQSCAQSFICSESLCIPTETELCDGADNDLDSVVDEDLIAPSAMRSVGVCQGLTKRCIGEGGWVDPPLDQLEGYEEEETRCDGLDNDCDGRVDELLDAPLVDPQYGVCVGIHLICEGSAGWVPPDWRRVSELYEVAEISCDNIDNDCDGRIDEGVDGIACQTGAAGRCAGGLTRCLEGDLACIPVYDEAEEQCNGVDDDCDGSIDEEVTPPADLSAFGVCQRPISRCEMGQWSLRPVDLIQGYESIELSCDGLDNDCDGFTDEGLGGENCLVETAIGPCRQGIIFCIQGNLSCLGDFEISPEICDGIDSDCDGGIDEGITLPLYENQRGVCAGLTWTCEGTLGMIEADPTRLGQFEALEMSCDGLDNDCDGLTDEGILSLSCSTGLIGQCSQGETVCHGGRSDCIGPLPAAEVCDGIDNDCDGGVDEELIPPQAELSNGICAGDLQRCAGAEGWINPDPPRGFEALELSCDGLDNDCDGLVDEGDLSTLDSNPSLRGVCINQRLVCQNGQLRAPSPEERASQLSQYELIENRCDGLDNDCDGQVDEEPEGGWPECNSPLRGPCLAGRGRCLSGEFECEPIVSPEAERCDMTDNDCDGRIDEDLVVGACVSGEGICAVTGETRCIEGRYRCDAIALSGGDELCNAIDDDCDGSIDEDFALAGITCSEGVGACTREGVWQCELGTLSCDAIEGASIQERCDGIDNDCDGSTDEDYFNLAQPCIAGVGVCEIRGFWRCSLTGALQCGENPPLPEDERCDWLDNDCDGLVDEHKVDERCDSLDNDCDGLVDETLTEETCNQEDDDCDGIIDESPCAPCLDSDEGCPELSWASLPAGDFLMGGSRADELPLHPVQVRYFELSDEVSVSQYQVCVRAGFCTAAGTGGECNSDRADRDHHPINCVSWLQAHQFAYWVGGRLPSESEWEYAARGAGLAILTPWGGDEVTCDEALLRDDRGFACGLNETAGVRDPRNSAGVSPQGLWDLLGNVSEWVEDDYFSDYEGAPSDTSPRCDVGGCDAQGDKVHRGGGWRMWTPDVDNRARFSSFYLLKSAEVGFRIARYGRPPPR